MTASGQIGVLHGSGEIAGEVGRLGAELSAAYPEGVLLVGVLRGSLYFLADLVRAMGVPCEVEFLAISPYTAGTGRVRIVKDLEVDVAGREVVLVEDIVDTGLTCSYVLGELRRREPASVEVCCLFDRRARRIVPVPIRFVGFEAPDELLLGYGLDVAGRYRNLPFVAVGDRHLLQADPDAYVEGAFGR